MRQCTLSGWGRYPTTSCLLAEPSNVQGLADILPARGTLIARGNGRSYGDSSLNPDGVLSMQRLDRMLSLSDDGVLTCEAGTLLADIIDAVLPRGWFPPVTPGTKLVTVGGMIASDVHGKNHHGAGSFCDHLLSFDLALANGSTVTCSNQNNAELFAATCGGMGLTGIILRAKFRLIAVETAKIRQQTIPVANLDQAVAVLDASHASTYAVAWIDCLARGPQLGRSVIFLGEHASLHDLAAADRGTPFARPRRNSHRVPIDFPGFAMSRSSVQLFNAAYFRAHRAGVDVVDLDPYFYPLDTIHDLNRVYGRRGFVQYQTVLPISESRKGLHRLLSEISKAGQASFLAVLKRMGRSSFGMMSFPLDGYTLALDFPATPKNLALLDHLDVIVKEHGGRIYLAKDARTSAAMIRAGYPRLEEFRNLRKQLDPAGHFSSLQSRRLEL